MKKHLLYIVCAIFSFSSAAQKEFRFRNFSINDGLSQSLVSAIVQDENGALWLGTQDGLNRFDGKEFEVFTADKTEGLESSYIKCGLVDPKGNLWFGTNNGLTFYNRKTETFKTFFARKGEVLQIEDIALGNNGDLWVASSENGLFRFNRKTFVFESLKSKVPSRKTTDVQVNEDGVVIVASTGGILHFYNSSKDKTVELSANQTPFSNVNRLKLQGKDEVLVTSNSGVYTIDVATKTIKETFPELTKKVGNIAISDVYNYQNFGWVIGTKNQGIYVIYDDGEIHQSTEDIFQKTSLLNNAIISIFRDNSGFLWIASQRGLSVFDPGSKELLGVGPSGNEESGIPTPSVWSFVESASTKYVYIGTDNGISRYDKSTGKFRQFYRKDNVKQMTNEISVLSIVEVNENLLLAGCTDGTFELLISGENYAYQKIKYASTEVEQNHQRSYSIEQLEETTYLIATKGGAITYDISSKQMQVFEHDATNPRTTISKGICRLAHIDKKGNIWLSTSTGGLNVMEKEGGSWSVRPYEYNAQLKAASKEYITSIFLANNGEYWFGTLGSGLLRWNPRTKKTSTYTQEDGLPNDVIYGVLRDEKGNFWMSTNKGLCQFNAKSKKAKVFTEINGLMSNECNIGAYLMASDGKMYFGGIFGYNFFEPSELSKPQRAIDVVFTKFKLESDWLKPQANSILPKPISEMKAISLSYQKRSFTLRFQPSDLSHPELVNYKYILEGSDGGEVLIGTSNEIHFNALAPGEYVLKVYARLGDGPWSEYPATLSIIVAAPFWEQLWFWIVLAVVSAIFIRWFVRRRIDSARREQVRLEMKIRDRTREIQEQNLKIDQQRQKIEEEKNKVVRQQKLLQKEKDKTEKLLKNVIPASTVEELKKRGKARARAYKKVSVLFTDFVGFTKISERMKPTELVKKLDVYFTKFDEIIVNNNLEKIKTIGDAYMCAGGVPVRNNTNPIDTCLAALEIQAYMEKLKNDAIANGKEYWELRLGINTGEVTAGIIGSERLAYDIWGSTVNQAQRMEMLGEPGKITISGATFNLIEPYFECTFRGKAQSKSRGLIDMYTVEQIKPELSIKGQGLRPNDRFNQIVNLHLYSSINYYKAERHIMQLLEQRLSKNLHYHSIAHTKDVVTAVERIALLEGVTDEGLFLLKSAATYHDAGFIEQYDKNEPIGVRLAGEILPKYGYTDKHIDRIKELINVTTIPHKPKNKLEEIICDADLDYLGRDDFHEIADKLRRELKEHGKIEGDKQWDEIQVMFLKQHKFFTKTAIKTRRKKKRENLKEVQARLERDEYED
ncbi:MAG: adenylate/guanylate cyclase domain-containing protein [Crocinitomicaceae bacterium]|nr:adenylate/guanylate cyclase domain-containing protein [Crocinitomicaceae bacterium]